MPPRVFVADLPVRSYEVDFAGVVNNAVFVNYLEHGRMEVLRELSVPWEEWERQGLTPVIRRLELDYLAPARLLDRLRVETWIEELGHTSMRLGQRVVREDGTRLLEARVVGVFVGGDLRPVPLPPEVREGVSGDEIGARPEGEGR